MVSVLILKISCSFMDIGRYSHRRGGDHSDLKFIKKDSAMVASRKI
jgi:hypothetical protein